MTTCTRCQQPVGIPWPHEGGEYHFHCLKIVRGEMSLGVDSSGPSYQDDLVNASPRPSEPDLGQESVQDASEPVPGPVERPRATEPQSASEPQEPLRRRCRRLEDGTCSEHPGVLFVKNGRDARGVQHWTCGARRLLSYRRAGRVKE